MDNLGAGRLRATTRGLDVKEAGRLGARSLRTAYFQRRSGVRMCEKRRRFDGLVAPGQRLSKMVKQTGTFKPFQMNRRRT